MNQAIKERWINKNSDNVTAKLICSFIIGFVDCILYKSEIKSMVVIILMLFFSAFWGIVNQKKAWLTAILIWSLIPVNNFLRIYFIQEPYLTSKSHFSLIIFSILTLILCFLGAYSSVFARSIARRARL